MNLKLIWWLINEISQAAWMILHINITLIMHIKHKLLDAKEVDFIMVIFYNNF